MPELLNEAFLLRLVEIDHDVAAKNDVIAPGQKFGLQVVEVELNKFFELRLDGIFVTGLFEVTESRGVVHRLHLNFRVQTRLASAKTGITDVRSHDFKFPWRRNERLGRGHLKRERIAEIVVRESVTDKDGDGIGFLARRT